MKRTTWPVILMVALAASLVVQPPAFGQRVARGQKRTKSRMFNTYAGIGARTFAEHSQYLDRPYEKGEWGYGLSYEFHEGPGLWQLAATYAPDSEVIQPQLNLIYQQSGMTFGLGGTTSYQLGEVNEWGDAYWQWVAGFGLKFTKKFNLNLAAYYVYKSWNDLGDFDLDDLDYGVWTKFRL
ncbi:MAG: hypothetical protein JXR37_05845 [Kiritimatiellae bacterium]|nr:hypothetical protein [Kiritimatiellia bacterium]